MGALRPERVALLLAGLLLPLAFGCDDLSARKLVKEGNDEYKKGEFKAAVAKYDQALKLSPTLEKAWINRAYACQNMFTPALKTPENEAAAKCLLESLGQALKMVPDRQDLKNLQIQTWIDSGDYATALGHFKALIDKNPKDLESVKTMPVILIKAGKFDEAIEWYKRRLDLEPTNPEAFYAMGVMYWERLHDHPEIKYETRRRMADDALAPLQRALTLNPKYIEAMTYVNLLYRERALGWDQNNEAELKKQKEDTDKANEWEQKALALMRAQHASPPPKTPPPDGKDKKK